MMTSNANDTTEAASTTTFVPGNECDLAALVRQIRICRSALGAILDEIELGDRSEATIDKIAACITGVTGEIEALWEAAKSADQQPGRV